MADAPATGTAGAIALGDLVRLARRALSDCDIDDPALEARLLVEHLTGTTRVQAISDPGHIVVPEDHAAVIDALRRRRAGEPVHRIIGWREFHGLQLGLSPGTLEPRPDTEALVDLAIPHARAMAGRHAACRILDLGTGTGAIALALLAAVPQATALGIDISDDALATAASNADINGLKGRFDTRHSDWFSKVTERFHIIVSNPPYIPSAEIAGLQVEVREHDPVAALDGGADGLDPYRGIAARAARFLAADGVVAVETGSSQKADVVRIFAEAGYRLEGSRSDLAGRDRALAFRRGAL